MMQVLVLGFKKSALVNTIAMIKSAEWLVGKVWRVWKTFHDIYVPGDSTSEMSMKNELMKRKLKKTKDPMDLDDCIAGVAVQYVCIVEEKEKYKMIIRASKKCLFRNDQHEQANIHADETAQVHCDGAIEGATQCMVVVTKLKQCQQWRQRCRQRQAD